MHLLLFEILLCLYLCSDIFDSIVANVSSLDILSGPPSVSCPLHPGKPRLDPQCNYQTDLGSTKSSFSNFLSNNNVINIFRNYVVCRQILTNSTGCFRDDTLPPNTFYFTHSGTILKLLSHLGLYKDPQPLTADSFSKPRLWKTSKIDAFGSNLAFILYK